MADKLLAPQLVMNARMLILCYVPADPKAAAKLLPRQLKPARNKAVFLNQYVVDQAEQTSGFGAYSLTYAGLELTGFNIDKATQGRWWTHYLNSSPRVRAYAKGMGIPAETGETELVTKGDTIVATTYQKGKPLIRSTVRVGSDLSNVARGHLRYLNRVGKTFYAGRYAYVMPMAQPLEVIGVEFLDPKHAIYALRPAEPFKLTAGFCSPRGTFCYPGGHEPIARLSR
jgi:hypothetical protein